MASGVCVTSLRMLMRRTADFTHYSRRSHTGLRFVPLATVSVNSWNFRGRQSYCTNTSEDSNSGDVSVEYIQGLPHLTIPLPSRNEKCRFALKPVSHRVGDLINMLKTEDRGIDRATILNQSGVRIASTCNIESLMDEPFWIHINDQKYKVVPPKREKVELEDLKKLGDVKALVAQLYEALHVGEYHIEKEQELNTKLEDLKYQLAPLERQKSELSAQAERKTNIMTWVGLGLMSVQFGILARLTWWEYSWDIMEPVTYFVTYGTAMAMYAYYCVTKTEYNIPEVKDRHYLLTLYKRAKKRNFDVETYNSLRRQIAEIEYDLRRLRDPLNLQLPPHVDRSQEKPPLKPGQHAAVTSTSSTDVSSSTVVKKSGFKIPFLDSKN
ncbi:mitochondrial calcium uniporter isoform X2 [Musca autumnalis]|uniref:mitochondrial calcium uniporter isoform X2 n=1 Tax=Musca autumnalis TaxID=221902 RepID=UPI003CF06D80